MAYINCGVKIAGERPKYKKELKEAVKTPEGRAELVFDVTSLFEGREAIEGADLAKVLAEGNILSVTGPDPYIRRSWYANIKATTEGIEVS